METEAGLFGRSRPAKAGSQGKAAPGWREPPKVLHSSEKESVTVFVSNLAYTLEEPGEKLRKLFAGCGEVADVRPVFSHKGAFRGYCYVEFADEKAALQALSMDRTHLEGRPVFVSPCVDKTKNPDFKVPLSLWVIQGGRREAGSCGDRHAVCARLSQPPFLHVPARLLCSSPAGVQVQDSPGEAQALRLRPALRLHAGGAAGGLPGPRESEGHPAGHHTGREVQGRRRAGAPSANTSSPA